MLLLLLLVGFGMAEKSVLIIGGDQEGTIEQFFPSNLTSRVIATIEFPAEQEHTDTSSDRAGEQHSRAFQVTPLNTTHVFVLQTLSTKSFFMNQTGHLTQGPTVKRRRDPGLTSIRAVNRQMLPIFCGGDNGSGRYAKDCYVVTAEGQPSVRSQTSMLVGRSLFSLTAFGSQLVAIDGEAYGNIHNRYSERFTGSEWVKCENPPRSRFNSVAVKLNETSLLSCSNRRQRDLQGCFVYHVNNDNWVDLVGLKMKLPISPGHMVLIGETIYAFGQDHNGGSKIIQTLNISGGVETAQWKIEEAKLKKSRVDFGVWVVDSEDTSMELQLKGAGFSSTALYVAIAIIAALFLILLLVCCARRKRRTQNPLTNSDETRLYVEPAEINENEQKILI